MEVCEYCKKEYECKRSTSRYCSPKCRKLAFQEVSVPAARENAKDSTPDITDYGLSTCQCQHCKEMWEGQVFSSRGTEAATDKLNKGTLEICRANGYDHHVIDGIVYPIYPGAIA